MRIGASRQHTSLLEILCADTADQNHKDTGKRKERIVDEFMKTRVAEVRHTPPLPT